MYEGEERVWERMIMYNSYVARGGDDRMRGKWGDGRGLWRMHDNDHWEGTRLCFQSFNFINYC